MGMPVLPAAVRTRILGLLIGWSSCLIGGEMPLSSGEMRSKTRFYDTNALLTHYSRDDAGEQVARRPRPARSLHHRRVRKPASSRAGRGSRFRAATSTATAAGGE